MFFVCCLIFRINNTKMRLVLFIITIIFIVFNLRYLYINEEFVIFVSLLIFFIIFFSYTRKGVLVVFYHELKNMYLRFLFLFNTIFY